MSGKASRSDVLCCFFLVAFFGGGVRLAREKKAAPGCPSNSQRDRLEFAFESKGWSSPAEYESSPAFECLPPRGASRGAFT